MEKNFGMKEYSYAYRAVGVCLRVNLPVILWGAPGQGKTKVVEHFAKQTGRELTTILASIREPQDFVGLPAIVNDKMEYRAPSWALSLAQLAAEGDAGIVFFDEVSTAPPSVQAALLRVCLEKVVGDCELGLETRVIAAANPPDIAADGWDLAPPLANRFCHIDWELPAEAVAKGFSGSWPSFDLPEVTDADLEQTVALEKLAVAAFLKRDPAIVTVMPESTNDQGRAFPTPRSWEMAARVSAAVTLMRLEEDLRFLLIEGCVGHVAAMNYCTFRTAQDLPDPEEVIANPMMELPKRPDQLYYTGYNVLNALSSKNSSERWDQVGEFIYRLCEMDLPDIALSIHHQWTKLAPQGNFENRKISIKLNKFRKYLETN